MKDQWTSRLSEYIDDELGSAEREALEAHLDTCADCRRTLQELRAVVARAQAFDNRSPKTDLWPGVARRIGVTVAPAVRDLDARRQMREHRNRRFAFTGPQLAAAAVVFLFAGGGAALMMRGQPQTAGVHPSAFGQAPTASLVTWTDSTRQYDASVAELQLALESGRSKLDTVTVRVLRQNLAIIDTAIAEARAALVADPSSTYLNLHLAQTMRTKLELLRRARAIAVQS